MATEEDVRAAAQAFANALDRNDFEGAAAMLAATCRYDLTKAAFTAEETLVGPAAIVESYRWHDARARSQFDRIEYFSVVEEVAGLAAVIRFSDILEKSGERHTYSCRQRITISDVGLIDAIVQEDIPEEKASVRAFMERVRVAL